jgi:beta-glucosidase/6-phospho-beta-glucosidase/beta-galactosidase
VLVAFHKRYPAMPIMIAENGIADSTDLLRAPYLVEHLLAVRAAMDVGVPVQAYVFWTITDNLEWADGYCPSVRARAPCLANARIEPGGRRRAAV